MRVKRSPTQKVKIYTYYKKKKKIEKYNIQLRNNKGSGTTINNNFKVSEYRREIDEIRRVYEENLVKIKEQYDKCLDNIGGKMDVMFRR